MTKIYDVIVVGAGPAGSMTAKDCADKGLNTILLDKEAFPRTKLCAGGVSKKALDLIGEDLPEEIIEGYVHGFRLYSTKMDCVELKSKDMVGITTTRSQFDSFLVDIAKKKGAEFRQNSRVVDVLYTSNSLICKLENGEEIEGKILVGSDGANGIVAKKANIRERWNPDEIGVCVESSIKLDADLYPKLDTNFLELYFLDIPHSCGWIFPKKHSVSIGIGVKYNKMINQWDIFNQFYAKICEIKDINLKAEDVKGHILPAGGLKRKTSTDRVLLAGDAAGFIDAFTGEGIYYALKSGKLAADACCHAIEKNQYDGKFFLKHYDQVCETEFIKDLKRALKISLTFYKHTDFFLNMLKISNLGESWADLATGKRSYRSPTYKFIPPVFKRGKSG